MPLVHPRPWYDAVRPSLRAVTLAIPAMLAAAGSARQAVAQETFVGTVVYEASAGGSNADGAEMFNSLGPRRETVTWGRGGNIRLETVGGMMEGIVIVRLADSAIYTLDPAARVARGVWMHSLNVEDAAPDMLAWMREQFAPPEMERTDEVASYAGHHCRMYRIVRSTMLRRGATGRACIAEDIQVRPSRYSFDGKDSPRLMVSLPLQFGIREGLPLMLEVNEDNTIVTYRAVALTPGEPAASVFSPPAGYTVLPRVPG
jgi:hypothetical protein